MAIQGKCHCGATRFELSASLRSVTRCTCTFCSKRGVLWAYCEPDQFAILSDTHRTRYGKSGLIHHYHCGVCGCGTYTDSPEWGAQPDGNFAPHPTRRRIGINARLFEDLDLELLPVEVLDGKNLW
jgi:hypothetical protein